MRIRLEVYQRSPSGDLLTFKSDAGYFQSSFIRKRCQKKIKQRRKRSWKEESRAPFLWWYSDLGLFLGARSVVYMPIDHSDTPPIMFHQTRWGCPLASVSDGLLMMDGWLTNAKLASPYLVRIYGLSDILMRQSMHRRSAFYPDFIKQCLTYLICIEVDLPQSLMIGRVGFQD